MSIAWDELETDESLDELEEQPAFHSLPEFVDWITSYYRRSGISWCRQWWRHAEAVVAFEALWRAFEELRLVPGTGSAIWMKEYCEPMMRTLTSPSGTFGRCTPEKCTLQDREELTDPPPDMFLPLEQ